MDTVAHSLWSVIVGRSARSRVRWWAIALTGAGPDLVWLPFTFINLLTSGRIYFFQGPYNISHSLVIWAAGTLLLMLFWKKSAWQWTWPWAFHIVIDMLGHIDMPTPILWPISSWHVVGLFDWLTLELLAVNYFVLVILLVVALARRHRKKFVG